MRMMTNKLLSSNMSTRLRLYRQRTLSKDSKGKNWSRSKKILVASTTLGGVSLLSGPSLFKSDGGDSQIVEDKLPLDYDVTKMQDYFNKRPVEVTGRALEIMSEIIPYFTRLLIWEHLIRRKIKNHEGLQKKYAVKLREMLTRLGPCFIKLGQAVSIRPDILPSSFLFELQKLCDAVPSFPTEAAVDVIESELGQEVDKMFLDLDRQTDPVAAASLGQVYKVHIEGGDTVGVKVQRPDMHQYVLRDLYIVRQIARVAQWIKTTFTYQRPFDVALLDTFGTATLLELDYLNEAENQQRCKDELEPRLNGRIYIPKVYHDLTTRKVLVTEWIEGEQLAKSPPEVINKLIPVGVECFLVQLLETGFFHADPHPGNLLVTPEGKLALIDFGLMANVPIQDTKTMTKTIVHLMQGDVPGLVDDAVELGFLPLDVDRTSLTPVLQKVFDSAQLAITDQVKEKFTFTAIQSRRKQFWAVSGDLNKIFYLYPFLVPDYFALITRAMIVLEGIAVTGDPDFDLFRAAYPYSLKHAISLFGYKGVAEIAQQATVKLLQMGVEVTV